MWFFPALLTPFPPPNIGPSKSCKYFFKHLYSLPVPTQFRTSQILWVFFQISLPTPQLQKKQKPFGSLHCGSDWTPIRDVLLLNSTILTTQNCKLHVCFTNKKLFVFAAWFCGSFWIWVSRVKLAKHSQAIFLVFFLFSICDFSCFIWISAFSNFRHETCDYLTPTLAFRVQRTLRSFHISPFK